jgi:SAM-dependent methyltransferase
VKYLSKAWATFYDDIYGDLTNDIPFYLNMLNDDPTISVLELGCGTGRVTVPLSQEGPNVTGLDNSEHMLKKLRSKICESSYQPTIIQADMIRFNLGKTFDLILIPYRGFQSLTTVKEQEICLKSINKSLKKNGRVIINLFPPIRAMFDQKEDVNYLVKEVTNGRNSNKHTISHRTNFDQTNQIVHSSINIVVSEFNQIKSSHWLSFDLRYLYLNEAAYLFQNNGFKILDLFGDYNGGSFNSSSEDMIWILQPSR